MKRIILLLFSLFAGYFAFSQNSGYVESFDWMVKTIEENDAGFQYVIEAKGANDYARHTESCREKIKNAGSKDESVSIMNSWLEYFRKGHIGVFIKDGDLRHKYPPQVLSEAEKDSVRMLYKNEERVRITPAGFKQYLSKNKGKIHPVEGIWKSDNYTIGIIRSDRHKNQFDAFIIKADSIYWMPGQKKAGLTLNNDSGFDVSFSMKNHAKEKTSVKWLNDGYNIMSMMNSNWFRIDPEPAYSLKDSLFLSLNVNYPLLLRLNDRTVYLRIPSFNYDQKPLIDSLLSGHDNLLRSVKNLIIDIRWGTGGSDFSYFNIIPYAYTNPVRWVGMKFRATQLNAQCYEHLADILKSDTAASKYCLKRAKDMRDNLGGYVDSSNEVEIDSAYTRSEYPAKIAIICNKFNASTDESFLYIMRQSLKVKIFGRPTQGAIDISNVNEINFATDSTLYLWYAMSVSKRLPDYIIDGVGVQPDYFMDGSIKEEDWVEYVQKIIETE